MILSHALDAVAVANELLQAKTTEGKPILNSKKIKLAYSLGKIVDTLSPEVTRFKKLRMQLLEEHGTKTVAFSSKEELSGLMDFDYTQLSADKKAEHEDRFCYQVPADEFEKMDKNELKIIDAEMFVIAPVNIKPFNDAISALIESEISIDVKIPIEAFDDIEYENIVSIVLGLHEIVEGI